MRNLIVAAALVAAGPAFADKVATSGNDQIRLIDAPCPYASVLRFIPENRREEFRKADTRIGGQRFFACWLPFGDYIGLVY